jgi:hypothetical protein
MLTHDEAVRLKNEDPRELDRRALAEREDFLFGVRDLRESFGRDWGGEFRVFINQNVVLHFLPCYTEEMKTDAELPQFAVVADEGRAGRDVAHRYEGFKDLDPFDGVVFYVSPADYRQLVAELASICGRYDDYPRLPDTLFGETSLVKLVAGRVLEHPIVRAERAYDFSKRTF